VQKVAKTILVTGANGYIGQKVVEQLLNLGINVLAADLIIDGIDPRADRLQVNLFENPEESRKESIRLMLACILPGATDLTISPIAILTICPVISTSFPACWKQD